ncbi:hypothetical protein [Herbiconiux sp. L3-i23]|uniref:hypothetical protein n=1 Tax=Herbiconiux sp. L3-i23 TaxID=2905871 RepID=UPI002063DD38|nr:hypothetical protein [Herbiconiux sp. L3-i23]BDI21823.1 hypothetical protein L3i23_05990 [Herbiconiux sp. L3-i23]
MITYSWLILAGAGSIALALSYLLYARANPTQKIPWASQPRGGGALQGGLRFAGSFVLLFGVLMFGTAMASPWLSAGVLLLAYVPAFVAIVVCNRLAGARQDTSDDVDRDGAAG